MFVRSSNQNNEGLLGVDQGFPGLRTFNPFECTLSLEP